MPLYTFVMNYAGGTYFDQVKAASVRSACIKWATKLDLPKGSGIGSKSKESLMQQMKEEIPMPLDGLKNAWCTIARVRGNLALVDFIETV